MKRKHKKYSRPKRPFEKSRIEEEAKIKEEFGLKNKKEIWKAEAKVKSMREKAKRLISAKPEEQKALFNKLNKIGMDVNSISAILSLDKRDYLKRRLQTILVTKKLSSTPKQARQFIVHKKVFVDDKVVNKPSYIVPVKLENKIKLKEKKKPKKKGKMEESKGEKE
ncbi:MAG: 30S ribosomal protein S4 [Candidatus Diapherotrites archaeon]